MKWEGNIRRMIPEFVTESDISRGEVHYGWCGADVLKELPAIAMQDWFGKEISVVFDGTIHCTASGKKIRKTFGEGMSYQAWQDSPLAMASIFKPELSRIHEGIALRDEAWEREHHLKPHWVYLTQTSEIKVGVTRSDYGVRRWMDQGAVAGIVVAEVPYRQLAGEMEVALKEIFADKTNWRKMLGMQEPNAVELDEAWEEAQAFLFETDAGFEPYLKESPEAISLNYPVLIYPEKVQSIKLDKVPQFREKLNGVKGQYLIFDSGRVLNVRTHAGYRVRLEVH